MSTEQFVIHANFLEIAPSDFGGDNWSIVTDPPYSPHVHASATSCGTGNGSNIRDANGNVGAKHRDLGFDPLTSADRAHLGAVAARCAWTVIFSDIEGGQAWRDVLPRYVRTIPWIRWSMPQLSGDRPPQGAEYIVTAADIEASEILLGYRVGGRMFYNGPGNLTHFDETALRGADKHKCEKPLDLCCRLVEYFSKEGDVVLDPYAGSAAIGVACRELGRSYVGIERDEEWASRANARLAAPLGERDVKRFAAYLALKDQIDTENVRRAKNTAAQVAKKQANTQIDHNSEDK